MKLIKVVRASGHGSRRLPVLRVYFIRLTKLAQLYENIVMSGHSKWSTIKHKKAITDAKRSKIFSKISALISIAAREKGGDPASNPTLRTAIEKAREVNMPRENIDRAVKRGTGEIAGARLEEITYGAFGPGGAAILITTITDNKNRTLAELKKILSEHGGKFVETGSIQWMFRREGADWVPNSPVKIEDENIKKKLVALYEALDDQQDVSDIYTSEEEVHLSED